MEPSFRDGVVAVVEESTHYIRVVYLHHLDTDTAPVHPERVVERVGSRNPAPRNAVGAEIDTAKMDKDTDVDMADKEPNSEAGIGDNSQGVDIEDN